MKQCLPLNLRYFGVTNFRWLVFPVVLFFFTFTGEAQKNDSTRGMKPVEIMIDSKPHTLYKQCNALLIGASNYNNGFDTLKGVVADIEAVRNTLTGLGFFVQVKFNPTDKADLEGIFYDFITDYGQDPESCLLFYFAGHGITRKINGITKSYILPVSCPKYDKDRQGFMRNALPLETIENYAKEIGSKHALFLFDACFSGGIFTVMRGNTSEAINYKTLQKVRMFITSGSADEQVPDQSIFRDQFIYGLNGEADFDHDQYVTGTELFMFIEKNVLQASKSTLHPQFGKMREYDFDKGDFVFELKKNATSFGLLKVTANYPGSLFVDGSYKAAIMADSSLSFSLLQGSYTVKFSGGAEEKEENIIIYPDQTALLSFTKSSKGPSELYPDMVLIPGGSTTIGSDNGDTDEKPVHTVKIDTYQMGKYEVTVNQFSRFINETGYQTDAEKQGFGYVWTGSVWEKKEKVNWKYDVEGNPLLKNQYDQPVIHVSWNDAHEYCSWLSLKTGKHYRLPTEAEWEYAAGNRAQHTCYSWGNEVPTGKTGGNLADLAAGKKFGWNVQWDGYNDEYATTAPVGNYDPNTLGLFDMTGNVWEWCNDWYGYDYYTRKDAENPQGPSEGRYRVVRGGSCFDNPEVIRVSERSFEEPQGKKRCTGFRVVCREPEPGF